MDGDGIEMIAFLDGMMADGRNASLYACMHVMSSPTPLE
jgi:hypothetical protein